MLLFVSADVKQATIVQVKFQKWLSKMKVIGTKEDSHSVAETRSERCVKSAPVNPEKNISGQRNYNRSRRSSYGEKQDVNLRTKEILKFCIVFGREKIHLPFILL